MATRHYLNELKRDELKPLILYPSQVWSELYEIVAQYNSDYACDLIQFILGKDYDKWTTADSCSYDWYLNIASGQYRHVLDIDDYDYFTDEDKAEVKKLQAKVKKLAEKIDNLDDCDDYYEKLDEWETEADEEADKIIQLVVKLAKEAEEVSDEQILDEFEANDMGEDYYYLDDDRTRVYRDYTKAYITAEKEAK